MSSSESEIENSEISSGSDLSTSNDEDYQSATASPEKLAKGLIDDEADDSHLEIPPTDEEDSDEEDVAPIRSTRKSMRFKNRIESDDSDEEVVALRKSVYAAHPDDSEDEPVEEQAYSKATRRSILGFLPKKSVVAGSDEDSSDESDAIIEEDEDDRTVSYVQDNKHSDSIEAEEQNRTHVNSSLEILEQSSASMVDLTEANASPQKVKPDSSLKVKSEARSPLKDVQSNRMTVSNESFDQSILEKMSSTLSIKVDSITEDTQADGPKLRVSPSTYEAEQQAIADLERKIISANKMLNMAHQLPDRGFKLRQTIEDNKKEMEKRVLLLATWEVDENLSVKNTIARSFQSSKNSFGSVSIDDSVEEVKMPAATSKQPMPGVDVRDVQQKHFGKVGTMHFQEQKAATVNKLLNLQKEIDNRPVEDEIEDAPKYLKVELMKHQRHAVKFMLWREASSPRGGILADDMGLGKTLTTISLIMKSIQRSEEDEIESEDDGSDEEDSEGWKARGRKDLRDGGTLVVCPASLVKQWEHEIKTKTKKGALETNMFHGPKRESRAKSLAKNDVVLTTYGTLTSDMKDDGCLFQIKWKRIILDEGHVIRNHKSKQSEAVCKLFGKYRWILTGTPIHNKEFDMYAAIKFLRCRPFHELHYWKTWIQSKSGESSERLQTLLKSILLRRTKDQLIETGEINSLPTKTLSVINVELSAGERLIYSKFLALSQTIFANFVKQQQERGDRDDLSKEKLAKMFRKFSSKIAVRDIKSHEILTLILRLRQCCCHPGLVKEAVENIDIMQENLVGDDSMVDHSTDDIMSKLQHLNIEDEPIDMDSDVFSMDYPSSKVEKVIDVLKSKVLGTPDKAIIVSQWTSYLRIVRGMLKVEGIAYCELTGEVLVKDRNDIVVNFNKKSSPQKVMLLSLTAGGVGLNLVGANYLFLMDVHWNPQLEQQAQDRIYRFGQEKPVNIFKFICTNTIEGQILEKQEEKLATAESALTGAKKSAGSKLTMADLHKMFGMDDL